MAASIQISRANHRRLDLLGKVGSRNRLRLCLLEGERGKCSIMLGSNLLVNYYGLA